MAGGTQTPRAHEHWRARVLRRRAPPLNLVLRSHPIVSYAFPMQFRPHILLVSAVLLLTSCGEGYVLEPGRFAVLADGPVDRDQVLGAISQALAEEGFDNLGRDDEMVDLISSGTM